MREKLSPPEFERNGMQALKTHPWLLTAVLAVGAVVLIASLSL